VSDTPLFADSLFGLRFWKVLRDEGGEALAGPLQKTPWPEGGQWLHAQCPKGHAAPAPDCECGVHAWHPRRSSARDVLAARGTVPGIVEAQGAIEVHEDGFRTARARPYALFIKPGSNAALICRLADRYDAAVVEVRGPRELLAYCREQHIGMEEQVVSDLLGTGDLRERRRARFRKDALRLVAALLLAGVLTGAGLALTSKEPPGTKLYGRTGEIRTH
jgi:hypothetical protein